MHRALRFPISAACVVAAFALPATAFPQETASDTLLTVDHYLDWEQPGDPQISPDGSQIVYTRRWVNKMEDKWESALWIMSVDGSRHAAYMVTSVPPVGRPDLPPPAEMTTYCRPSTM